MRNMLPEAFRRKPPPYDLTWSGYWNVYVPLDIYDTPVWTQQTESGNWQLTSQYLETANPAMIKSMVSGIHLRYETNLDSLYPDPSACVDWGTVVTAVPRGTWLLLLGTRGTDVPQ